ncbi:ornithine carbamoyltransferase [Methylibium sp.]|uniref:ornithine carbamoyltransferase n=1 Tax=Methylibium sp. TaxID=2067992 RepID=UPI003D13CF38
MFSTVDHRSLLASENMSPRDASCLLDNARKLQQAARAGTPQALLRGKNLGLLCAADDDMDAVYFRRAAEALGAHVAHIAPSLSALSPPQEVEHTARLLGRLYDGVECQGVAPELVQRISQEAGIPVYDGVARPSHFTARLADLLGGGASPDENRRFVLQAVLLSTMA